MVTYPIFDPGYWHTFISQVFPNKIKSEKQLYGRLQYIAIVITDMINNSVVIVWRSF